MLVTRVLAFLAALLTHDLRSSAFSPHFVTPRQIQPQRAHQTHCSAMDRLVPAA
jgi:hypothetical protein